MSWHNRYLEIDLTKGVIETKPLNQQWAKDFVGGRGLAAKYLYEMIDPKVDPLAPENVLIFATGPLTGTNASTSGRYVVATKGALTHSIGCSNSGGKFGAELKFAGYDMVIFKGKSPKPVYLLIEDENVSLQAADHLWGKTVWDVEPWLKDNHQSPQMKVASIGPAGEQGVKYACVVNDLHRAAGRCGVGAVMGSKHLKAIAVRGTRGVMLEQAGALNQVNRKWNGSLKVSQTRRGLSRYGTIAMLGTLQTFGGLPTRNFQDITFEGANKVGVEAMQAKTKDGHRNLIRNKACFGCTIGCGRICSINPDHFSMKKYPQYLHASGGLEYETAYAFGPVVGVDDFDACTFAGYIMNEYGLDPISFGVTLAAAMELYEMGVITQEETGGIPLHFGNAEALVEMSLLTGKGEGFGKILGLGSKLLCEKYGHPELFMGVKGQEFAGYDSRSMQGMGLGYATSPRGACHLKHDVFPQDMSDPSANGKAKPCKQSQDLIALADSLGLCIFTMGHFSDETFAEMLTADTGEVWDVKRVYLTGERIFNLEKLFNYEAGLGRADDSLPPRMLQEPLKEGFAKGNVCELDKLLDEYYELRGWDNQGRPRQATLQRLQLENPRGGLSVA